MTKIDVVSGFLGAGKTTFIKKMIEEVFKGEKLVLIENEFGEVGVDGGFLKDAGIEISEMNSGCICCSLVGDFDKNLREVIERFTPDRILIEPSGVGKLSDVMTSVTKLEESLDVKLNGLVTVVNSSKAIKQMKAFGEFFNNQIEYATTIVLSRTQEIDDEKLETCVKKMREHNAKAPIITTPWDKLDGEKLLTVIEGQDNLEMKVLAEEEHHRHEEEHHHHHEHGEDCTCGCHDHDHHNDHEDHDHHDHEHHHDHDHEHHHEHGEECTCGCHDHDHHHHHADEVFTSWGTNTAKKYTMDAINRALDALEDDKTYGMILRAKGMVAGEDGQWIYFDYVPGEKNVRTGKADVTGKICVIGSKLNEEAIESLF